MCDSVPAGLVSTVGTPARHAPEEASASASGREDPDASRFVQDEPETKGPMPAQAWGRGGYHAGTEPDATMPGWLDAG